MARLSTVEALAGEGYLADCRRSRPRIVLGLEVLANTSDFSEHVIHQRRDVLGVLAAVLEGAQLVSELLVPLNQLVDHRSHRSVGLELDIEACALLQLLGQGVDDRGRVPGLELGRRRDELGLDLVPAVRVAVAVLGHDVVYGRHTVVLVTDDLDLVVSTTHENVGEARRGALGHRFRDYFPELLTLSVVVCPDLDRDAVVSVGQRRRAPVHVLGLIVVVHDSKYIWRDRVVGRPPMPYVGLDLGPDFLGRRVLDSLQVELGLVRLLSVLWLLPVERNQLSVPALLDSLGRRDDALKALDLL